jgi:deoxyribodipyrimidine photo-lyase
VRVRPVHDTAPRTDGRYVLYWMTMYRRSGWNFALERAVRCAERLQRPLVVLEALRCDYPFASERLHRFVLEGMRDNLAAFARKPVLYYPYVEPAPGAGKGLLAALAREACLVVGDDYPAFMLPHMTQAAARQIGCRFELVDSNGLLPMRSTQRVFTRAVDFRRHLQKELSPWLEQVPVADPFTGRKLPAPPSLPDGVTARWPAATGDLPALASTLTFPHTVPPASITGGRAVALRRMNSFLGECLDRYPEERNEPEVDGTSGLSPYLHFGHISVHEIFAAIAEREEWTTNRLGKASGSKSGWWGMSPAAEAYLDQLVTWRELGFNFCAHRADHESYDSLPGWARDTLDAHAGDERPHLYAVEELEQACTHDPLWNAAQRQMMRDGWFHNYMRMLWGKKILEWSAHPRDALANMIHLMNKYSLDGRGPNACSGYFWTLGRYDRPWGPERPIFGTVRYMSSANTARKFPVKRYVEKYGARGGSAGTGDFRLE